MEKLEFNQYQSLANELMSKEATNQPLLNAALGLAGESGEFADIIKKHLFQGHDLDKEHLKEELGDILWYIAEACKGLDITLEEVASRNIEKLYQRFNGNHFDSERSKNR
ncbi:nucleotide pyrophosphohydrolase [Treponema rectale]|uniref:Nucleotide pyrophosphohydrolase n=1 Tax=Treponema rectale TaxID=744512 RepID=A0A7M1XJC5_9SPIR|nr:nucleotide pyrophosphohydrolase [Treponema rectale]